MAYSEVSVGRSHNTNDIPMITAGKAGGTLRTGLHHQGNNESVTKMHLTLARALGLPWQAFGQDEHWVDSTIEAIET